MGHLIKKGKPVLFHAGFGKLAVIGLLVALSSGVLDTIWAVYLDSFLNSAVAVSILSGVLTAISLISFFLFVPLIERRDKEKLFSFSLIVITFLLIAFAFVKNVIAVVVLSVILILAINLRISSFGVIVKDKSKNKNLAKNEGIIYTMYNAGWLVGPIIAAIIVAEFSYKGVFLTSSLIIFLSLILFKTFKISDHKKKQKTDTNLIRNLVDFFKSKDRVIAYILGGGVNFWWVLIYLFVPLFLVRQNVSVSWISIFLFAVAVPNILFCYFFADLASRKGFKKLFILGYSILALAALMAFFFQNVYFILSVLVLASIGTAMIESTTESYFLDILKGKEVYRFYSPYNTTIDVNHLVAKLLPVVVLFFLPFKFVFLFFALSMLFFVGLAFKTKKIIESRRNN